MSALHLRGVVLPGGDQRDLYIVDGKITFEPQPGARTLIERGYLIPGLFDAHAHLEMNSPAGDGALPADSIRASARQQLEAGVLALREPGGPSRASTGIGPREGLPRTFTSGRLLAPPDRYVPGLARSVTDAELAAAAEEEAFASGSWAKVVGDFPVPGAGVERHYSASAMADAARRVHALGARIALHAIRADVIEDGIAAGFDSIEHGTFLTPDHIDEMARRGTALVPTLTITQGIIGMTTELGMPANERTALLEALERQPGMVKLAAQRGVTVLAGTDAGMVPHGFVAHEMKNLLDAGLTPDRALGAASWDARRFFGLRGIEGGAPADILAYADDPRADPTVLFRPAVRILDGNVLT
jgi:imidazolonepropionase-like amidohydrolase